MKSYKNKFAFTMIELVFVIVVLGILAAVAIPKFAATRTDAQISKGRADVAAIRSAIVTERQVRLIKGQSGWITKLHGTAGLYFDNNGTAANALLMYGVTPENKDGHWHGAATVGTLTTYKYKLEGTDNTFTYNGDTGTFTCTAGTNCSQLTN
ncbi:type II secretion system GspH family protein [bacterium]|nr:type II secretion system GspH family protein [bacterium]